MSIVSLVIAPHIRVDNSAHSSFEKTSVSEKSTIIEEVVDGEGDSSTYHY